MRIAVSGTHYSGKTTLIEDLVEVLKTYESVEEPYHLMEEEGHEFSSPPTIEDFEDQLQYSLQLIENSNENSFFDRSPLDFVAYAYSLPESKLFDVHEWLPKIRKAMQNIDLVIFVPLENHDCIDVPRSEDKALRQYVDEYLREMLVDDIFGLDVEILEVSGDKEQRRNQVLARVGF